MKSVKDLIKFSKEDMVALKKNYANNLVDKRFKDLIAQLNVSEELLIKHTSSLMDCAIEYDNCKNCSGLIECKNSVKGFLITPVKENNKLTFSYNACLYQEKEFSENTFQKYVKMYEVPKDIKNANFKELYKDDKARMPIIKYFKEFMDDYDFKPKGLYLSGSFGSGKTYLIAALFNELAKKKVNSVIVYFPEFLRGLKSSFSDDYEERFQYIRKVPLLLLDDIGAENLTPWGRDEILGTILQYRMEEHLPTFFTSNLSLIELESHLVLTSNVIDKMKARRIIERIKQLTVPLELVSKNRRV